MAVGLALAVALTASTTIASAHVVVTNSVVADAGTTIQLSAAQGFTFDNRTFNNVPTGSVINVSFFDGDPTSPHTFTILNLSDYYAANWSTFNPAYLTQLINDHGTLFNKTADSDARVTGNFTSPKTAGYYEFVCILPGHFQRGMWGEIGFGEPVPSNISFGGGSPGPGLAVFIIVGTIVALTVLAIVLGFVVGRREGSEHEMPPERLGYPEPSTSEPLPPSAPGHPPAHP